MLFRSLAARRSMRLMALAAALGLALLAAPPAPAQDPFPSETNITVNTFPATLGAGQQTLAQFIAINYENFDWTAQTAYVAVLKDDGNLLRTTRINLPAGVTVGYIRQWAFTAPVTAPATPGVCSVEVQMAKSDGTPLGLKLAVTVNVVASGQVGAQGLSLTPLALSPSAAATARFTITNSGAAPTTSQTLQVWASPDPVFWSTRDAAKFGWQRSPTVSGFPEPREGAAMACDAARGAMILFGGSGNAMMSDTWEYLPPERSDQPGWRKLSFTGPSPRKGAAMVYDPARGVMVLFGGYNGTSMNDTWEFTRAGGWTRTATTGPAPRSYLGMVYDSRLKRVVLFGGGGDPNSTPLNDLWEYLPGTGWKQIATAAAPPPRAKHGMAYDSRRDRIIICGGRGYGQVGDMWQYTSAQGWVQLPNPPFPAHEGQAMIYDPKRDRIVMFGGYDYDYRGETWEWRDATGWRQVPTLGPATRGQMAAAYDPARGKLMVFGGWDSYFLGDAWELLCGGNDYYLGEAQLAPLAAGQSRTLEVTVRLPAGGEAPPPGAYWAGLIPDALGATRGESGAADAFLFPSQLQVQGVNSVRAWRAYE